MAAISLACIASCAEDHSTETRLGPDDVLTIAYLPGGSSSPLVLFIPVDNTCVGVGHGRDSTPYLSDLELTADDGRARLQDGLSYPTDCAAAAEHWLEHPSYDDVERAAVRVQLSGHLEQTRSEDLSQRYWTGEIHYVESWEGGRARTIILDHVPSDPS